MSETSDVGRQTSDRSPSDGADLLVPEVTLTAYGFRDEAEIAKAKLAAAGIRARVVADDEGGLNPGFFADYAVRLVVLAPDATRARAALGAEETIALPRQIRDAFIAHSQFCAPNEACGLVAIDADEQLRMVYCCTNVDRSPRRYTVAPQEHFAAIRHAERQGWVIGGAFHSHPSSEARPSPTDVAGALDPTWVHFIVGPLRTPEVRAFRIADGEVEELAIDVVETIAI